MTLKTYRFPLLESTIKTSKPSLARDLVILRENFFVPYYEYLDTLTFDKLFEGKSVSDVNALFTAVKAELDGGTGIHSKSNLTGIGKLVDKFMPQAMADKFFKNLPNPQSSQPVQGFTQKADQALKQLPPEAQKQAVALKAAGEKNPKLQGYLLGGLVALAQIGAKVAAGGAGAVGGPLMGAVVGAIGGGLVAGIAAKAYGKPWGEAFKQGLKGALSGAAVGALGGWMSGLFGGGEGGGGTPGPGPGETPGDTTYKIQSGDTLSDIAKRTGTSVDALMQANPQLTNPDVLNTGQEIKLAPAMSGEPVYKDGVGTAADTFKKIGTGQYTDSPISQAGAQKWGLKEGYIDQETTVFYRRLAEAKGHPTVTSVHLTNEGIGDMFKRAGSWLKTKAQNLTQNVTVDKLNQAWTNAGSPTDSDQIFTVLRSASVPVDVINKVYTSMGLPLPGDAGAGQPDSEAGTTPASNNSADVNAPQSPTSTVTGPDATEPVGANDELDDIKKLGGIDSTNPEAGGVTTPTSSTPDTSTPTAAPANPLDIESISTAYKNIANWDDRNKFRKDLLAKLDQIEDELEAGKVERGTNESKNFKFRSRFLGIEI